MKHFLYLFCAAALYGCANMNTTLSGGPKDETEPEIVYSSVSPGQTNFKDKKIVFSFDEYIDLNDPENEVILSPIPSKKPEIKKMKRSVEIIFREPLRENTTYTIDMGNAIRDHNEANVRKVSLRFSTGSSIDSLVLSGTIRDAYSGTPKENMMVGLYTPELYNDSANTRPSYITKADKNGNFLFNGLPPEEFRILAYEDKNTDMMPEKGSYLGFVNTLVRPDTSYKSIVMNVFRFEDEKSYVINSAAKTDSNLYRIVFNKTISQEYNISVYTEKRYDSSVILKHVKDTLFAFVKPGIRQTQLHITIDTSNLKIYTDSVDIKDNRLRSLKADPLQFEDNIFKSGGITINAVYPVNSVKPEAFILKADTLLQPVSVKLADPWNIIVSTPWKQGKKYTLFIADSAVMYEDNKYSRKQKNFAFQVKEEKDFGTVKINVKYKYSQERATYILELYNSNRIYSKKINPADNIGLFTDVNPGTYKVRVIKDDDNDNTWDSGNVFTGKQPERVINSSKDIVVKANWDSEAELFID